MAGVTDRPFRMLCKQLGAGYAVSEMVASNPALYGTDKSRRRIDHAGEAAPIAVQIAGADPALMAEAARYNVERGAQIIDINMGCPAKKVCNAAAGSALLANEPLVAAIVERRGARGGRAGHAQDPHRPASGRAQCGRASRASRRMPASQALTVHGRTRACAFVGAVEYDTIAAVKRAVDDSGDRQRRRRNARRARKAVLAHTGADAVMIGRAAQGRPWIFREIAHFLATGEHLPPPTVAEARALIAAHLADHYAFYGEGHGRAHRAQAPRLVYCGARRGRRRSGARCARRRRRDAQLAVVHAYFDALAAHHDRLPYQRRQRSRAANRQRTTAVGRGGPRSVTIRKQRLNGSNEICRSVDRSLEEYFKRLDGETPTGVYDMVIGHVERALLASIMTRAEGNQTQAADMLGMNRTTLRAKLVKHKLV